MMTTPANIPLGRLLANLCRLQASRADQLMDQIGLYRGQAILLLTLAEQDGLTHSEIAEKLCISPAAVSKVIKRLESLGYLQRTPDPADERVSRVNLLDGGWAVLDGIHSVFQKINEMLVKDIPPQEQEVLRDLLGRMLDNLQEDSKMSLEKIVD